jgi:predicted nucleotidyltransferase
MKAEWMQETVDCLRQALPAGSRIIVFGSHARGAARADGDLDLLLVARSKARAEDETLRSSAVLPCTRSIVRSFLALLERNARGRSPVFAGNE